MRLITYFEKAFKNPCFEVIQRPFYWSTHSFTRTYRILFVCVWHSAKAPWVATYFHHKSLVSILRILTNCTYFGLRTRRERTGYFRIKLLKSANITFFHIVIGVFLPWPVVVFGLNLICLPCASPTAIDTAVNIITRGHVLGQSFI